MAIPGSSAAGIVLGVGAGAATSVALEPAIEVPKQQAWANAPYRILDTATLARLVAQGGVDLSTAADEAKRDGFGPDKLDALVYLAQTVPGIGEAMALWRRGLMSDADFAHTLVKAGLDQRYAAGIIGNKLAEPVGLGDIAIAIVRGILPAPAYVPVPVPSSGDKVPRYPVVNLDPEALAAKLGYGPEELEIMVGRSGLSMAPVMAAQALFRGIIGPDDFLIAIGEGDLRTEWAVPLREASRQILTADQYMEAVLRGWVTMADGKAGAAKHGMVDADAQLLYEIRRRPLSVSTITKALARGGNFDTANAPFNDPYVASVHEADLGPEWYGLAEAMKYTYPSAFVVRALLTDGALSEAEGEQIFLNEGWEPSLAKTVATHYATGTGTATDPHVGKAQTQLWTALHRSYLAGDTTDAEAGPVLTKLGVAAGSQPEVLSLWAEEKSLALKKLTPAQVKKAYGDGAINPATGAAWTQPEALAYLIELHYSPADAAAFLAI